MAGQARSTAPTSAAPPVTIRHFTHLYRTRLDNTYHFCYGYLLLEDEKVLLVNWQPYMEKG